MATVRFQGRQFRVGEGGTPLALDAIAPSGLPRMWREIDVRTVFPEREYGRGYSSKTGLRVLLTASIEHDRKRWLHVSVSHRGGRLPTWGELCQCKDVFCGAERTAYQVHPPQSKAISIHETCLHLWCCLDGPVTPDFTRGGETI